MQSLEKSTGGEKKPTRNSGPLSNTRFLCFSGFILLSATLPLSALIITIHFLL